MGARIDDVHLVGVPLPLAVRADLDGTDLVARVVDAATGQLMSTVRIPGVGEAWTSAEVPPLPVGDYRVSVSGAAQVAAVSEIFTVVGEGAG